MPERPDFRAPKGTQDVLPPESARWEALLGLFARLASTYGYGLVQSPMFEDIGVFQRIGEGTDVVRKEMYDFEDKGGRHIALRPEGTAPVARAFVEHHPTTPWKVWYATPQLPLRAAPGRPLPPAPPGGRRGHRHGRPRSRRRGHRPRPRLLPGARPHALAPASSTRWATPADRPAYAAASCRPGLAAHGAELCATEDADKIENPLRVLDCKRDACVAVPTADAPDRSTTCGDRWPTSSGCRPASTAAGHRLRGSTPRLVRGLDYYTGTTFEFQSDALDGAQNAIGGGGRYDGLVEQMGGPPTPGIGFGIGIERVLLACDAEGVPLPTPPRLDVLRRRHHRRATPRDISRELRRPPGCADRRFDGRSMKAQMKAPLEERGRCRHHRRDEWLAARREHGPRSAPRPATEVRAGGIRRAVVDHIRKDVLVE